MRTVLRPSRDEVKIQRAKILADLGLTLAELREKADAGRLAGEQWAAWAEIDALNFLLGDEDG